MVNMNAPPLVKVISIFSVTFNKVRNISGSHGAAVKILMAVFRAETPFRLVGGYNSISEV
jgi:hypothetical protein